MQIRLLLLLMLICVTADSQAAKVYRWVGPDGNVHFGDRPPGADDNASQVETRTIDADSNVVESGPTDSGNSEQRSSNDDPAVAAGSAPSAGGGSSAGGGGGGGGGGGSAGGGSAGGSSGEGGGGDAPATADSAGDGSGAENAAAADTFEAGSDDAGSNDSSADTAGNESGDSGSGEASVSESGTRAGRGARTAGSTGGRGTGSGGAGGSGVGGGQPAAANTADNDAPPAPRTGGGGVGVKATTVTADNPPPPPPPPAPKPPAKPKTKPKPPAPVVNLDEVPPIVSGPAAMDDQRYDLLRSRFLNVNPEHYAEISFGDASTELKSVLATPAHSNGKIWTERTAAPRRTAVYGASHWCTNKLSQSVPCWYAVGGQESSKHDACGAAVGDSLDIHTATDNKSLHCKADNWHQWYGQTVWFNSPDRDDYIRDGIPGAAELPLNRLCAEFEFPVSRIRYQNPEFEADPSFQQVVNPNSIHPNLKHLAVTWGTYTAPLTGPGRKHQNNPETSGTFHRGGSHFYHSGNAKVGKYHTNKAFAIDSNTVALCIGPTPTGVRTAMRPTYAANPLMTVVGNDENGVTNAYSYVNHLTRTYIQFQPNFVEARHPLDLKLNRVWMMYEEDEIFAGNASGGVLGVDMIESGQSATYPIVVHNRAADDRQYRIYMAAGGNTYMDKPSEQFKLYVDENKNQILDADEMTELPPYAIIEIPANYNMWLIAVHKPDFGDNTQTRDRYGRNFAHATLSLIEVGRLRNASYAMRTWEGTAGEIADKLSILSGMQYPSADSDYAKYATYNERPDSPHLIRNTPDYEAFLNYVNALTTP